jgi:hypothetical protein
MHAVLKGVMRVVPHDVRVEKDDIMLMCQSNFTRLPLPNEDFGRPNEPFVDLSECVFEAPCPIRRG